MVYKNSEVTVIVTSLFGSFKSFFKFFIIVSNAFITLVIQK